MTEHLHEGWGRAFDESLAAFLEREVSRRASSRRADRDVVAAIIGRPQTVPRFRFIAAIASGGAALALVLVTFAFGPLVGLNGPSTTTPASTRDATATPSTYQAPFDLPAVAPGEPCPVTERWLIGTDVFPSGAALGGRPPWPSLTGTRPLGVYFYLAESGSPAFYEDETVWIGSPWKRIDVLWVAEPGFEGRFVVTAARLDGPGDVSFGDPAERAPVPRLEIDTAWGQPVATESGPVRPSHEEEGGFGPGQWTVIGPLPMLVKEPGCYGLEIDMEGGSTVSVFEVRPVEEAYKELAARPLQLPTVPIGKACPVTPISSEVLFRGLLSSVRGEGPVYMASGGGRWIFVTDSRELGPILVRGGRIDGRGDLRFDTPGGSQSTDLRLPIHSYIEPGAAEQPPGWREFLGGLHSSTPGCYAVQIDTLAQTQHLVFQEPS